MGGRGKGWDHMTASRPTIKSSPASTPELSFIIGIQELHPKYEVQPVRISDEGFWLPPDIKNAYDSENKITYLKWRTGNILRIANDAVPRNLERYSCATVFTQQPDTPHLFTVDFDARTRDVRDTAANPRGWEVPHFNHTTMYANDGTYSFIDFYGGNRLIAAPAPDHWDQLLPTVYNYWRELDSAGRRTDRAPKNAGLIGKLPLLVSLAAFSAPPVALVTTLEQCVRRRTWNPHQQESGHRPERGMVVTIYLDPNNTVSTRANLRYLEEGRYGPFYGP